MKTYKTFCCRLALVLAFLFPVVAQAQFTYSTNNNVVTVTGYSGTLPANLMIPSTVGSLPVVGIGANAFTNQAAIRSVTIPNSVTSLGTAIFSGCSQLASAMLGSGITNIPDAMFSACSNLANVNIPNGVISIGLNAFYSGNASTPTALSSVVLPNTVTSIAQGAFAATSLTNLVIPNSVVNFPGAGSQFSTCTQLRTVTLGSGITNIPDNMFVACTNLRSVNIPNGVISIGANAFYSGNASTLTALSSVVIPNSVTTIRQGAFAATSLTNIVVPDSVTNIGTSVFNGCSWLVSAVLGNGLPSIPDYMFYACTNLTSVNIPNGAVFIGVNAFYSGYANVLTPLSSVVIPSSVQAIAAGAFASTALTNVVIPSTVIGYGNTGGNQFLGCTQLRTVTLGGGLPLLAQGMFGNCPSLTNIMAFGNAPTASGAIDGTPATVYIQPGTTGWASTLDTRPVVLYAGAVTVNITPNNIGAMWGVDGGPLTNSTGTTIQGLSVTNHTISFSTVSGYTAPANTNATVIFSGTNAASATYLASAITAFNPTYNRGYLRAWQFQVANLLTNVTSTITNTVKLASLGLSTNGVTVNITSSGYIQYYNPNLVDDTFTYTVTNSLGNTATGRVTLLVASLQSTGGAANHIAMSGGQAVVSFAGIPGYKYQIQVSTNLSTWTTLMTTNAPANGVFQFTDTNPPGGGSAFYRLMWNGN